MTTTDTTSEFSPRTIHSRSDDLSVVKSAQRTLEILEFFADYQRPANVTQIAEALRYPQSSTSALLRTLTALGYLNYDRRARTFMTTQRVAILGGWLKNGVVREGWLVQILNTLSDRLGELVALVTRNGNYYVQYIYVKQGRNQPPCRIGIGHMRPLVLSSSGRALLCEASNAEIQRLVMRVNDDRRTRDAGVSAAEILSKVKDARERGYAWSFGEGNPNGAVISMPIPHGADRSRFAITVYGEVDRVKARFDEIVDQLRETTTSLSGLSDASVDSQTQRFNHGDFEAESFGPAA
jgi:DNA-binding IclR family transcriptional regulator